MVCRLPGRHPLEALWKNPRVFVKCWCPHSHWEAIFSYDYLFWFLQVQFSLWRWRRLCCVLKLEVLLQVNYRLKPQTEEKNSWSWQKCHYCWYRSLIYLKSTTGFDLESGWKGFTFHWFGSIPSHITITINHYFLFLIKSKWLLKLYLKRHSLKWAPGGSGGFPGEGSPCSARGSSFSLPPPAICSNQSALLQSWYPK